MTLMKEIRIAILEDDLSEQENTTSLLDRFFKERKLNYHYDVFNNPHDFLKADFNHYSLVLLDIIMPFDINGFDVSKKIREVNDNIAIMFLTKTVNYAIEGYEVKALDYLLKPLNYEDFALKMTKFLQTTQSKGSKVHAFKCKDALIKLEEKEIIYVDIYKHYLNIHTRDKVYVTRGNIKDIERELTNIFSRCSNYCIINFMYFI